jgi:hypothetical protein
MLGCCKGRVLTNTQNFFNDLTTWVLLHFCAAPVQHRGLMLQHEEAWSFRKKDE